MLISNVPQIQFTATGIVAPPAQAVLDGVLQDFDVAFGGGLSLDLSTPQGQLATSIAAQINDKNNQIIYLFNQFDPQYAANIFQDALGEIYFQKRKPGTTTKVEVVVNGLPGTVIPSGTLAKDEAGNIYSCFLDITIQGNSIGNGLFENITVGRIPCAANTLNIIYQSIVGWDTINNPADGILGNDIETRAEFEYRRNASVALNAQGTLNAIKAVVYAIEGILDVYVIDNPSSTNLVIGSITLLPYSFYVCAYAQTWTGILQTKVANAILSRKNPGVQYNGNTTVTVYNDNVPYDVKFQIAAPINIYFTINITNDPRLPNNIAQLVQNAIFNAFDEHIGALITGSSYYGIILTVSPLIQIQSVFVGGAPAPNSPTYQVAITDKPICLKPNIIVNLV